MSVTSRVIRLQARSTPLTLAEAMEPLRLFAPETAAMPEEAVEREEPRRRLRAVPTEHLEAAEGFLLTRVNVDEPLAAIQAAILVCEGAGDISEQGLKRLRVDAQAFPRAAAAVEWTRKTLSSPRGSWPEGFWPRFLLGLLSGGKPGH